MSRDLEDDGIKRAKEHNTLSQLCSLRSIQKRFLLHQTVVSDYLEKVSWQEVLTDRLRLTIFPIDEQQLCPFVIQPAGFRCAINSLSADARQRTRGAGIGDPLLTPVLSQPAFQFFTFSPVEIMLTGLIIERGRRKRCFTSRKQPKQCQGKYQVS